jgi:cell division protein FtsI/penicillin-binding protein 2
VADDETEQTFTFVGCFPADKPKYAVSMVVQRKRKLPASPAMVSDKVNELIEWLNKK